MVGALLETFVVGLIYPFISILKRPEIIQEREALNWFYDTMRIGSTKGFLIFMTIGLIVVYLLKNIYFVFLAYVQSRFIFNKQISFSRRLLTLYLHQPYTFHLQRNTAELLNKINIVVPSLFSGFLLYAMMFVIETITAIFILCLLILIKPLPSIIAVSVLGTAIFAFYRIIRKKIGELGKLKQFHCEQMIQWVNQGLGGIKETKVLGREKFFVDAYDKNSVGYIRAERFVHVINQLPRPVLETMCIISMLLITLVIISQNNEFQTIIPTLSLFAVAAFRIIPSMVRIFASVTQIRYSSYSLEVVYNDITSLDKSTSISKEENTDIIGKRSGYQETFIVFNKMIELRNVFYKYPNAKKPVLKGISLTIPKSCSIGFVGSSGAGKTTIVDIILGLLLPTQGDVLVDGKNTKDNLSSWQRKLGYIPQSIYLSDDLLKLPLLNQL